MTLNASSAIGFCRSIHLIVQLTFMQESELDVAVCLLNVGMDDISQSLHIFFFDLTL